MNEFEEQNANVEAACLLSKYAIIKKLGKFNSYDMQLYVLTILIHSVCTMNKTLDLTTSKQTAKLFCDRLYALIEKTQGLNSGNVSNRLN